MYGVLDPMARVGLGERRRPFRLMTEPLPVADFFLGPRAPGAAPRESVAMRYQFHGFVLDDERRELRLDGREIVLQPRVFDLLTYLLQHRERVVSKDELLEAVWSDVLVTEASLQRAVSLVRSALAEGGAGEAIRTYPRRGYRFSCNEISDLPRPGPMLPADLLQRARDEYERGAWHEAVEDFREADVEVGLNAADLERWAYAAECAGRGKEALGPLERAVAAYTVAGDRCSAARAAIFLAQIQFERRELAVARGWIRRAESLLRGLPACREWGLIEWMASRIAEVEGRHDEVIRRTSRVYELSRELDDPDLEALALAHQGLAQLAMGQVEEGAAKQAEAAVTVLSGMVTPWVGGHVYCAVISGCQNRGDWERAAQWTNEFTRWSEHSGVSAFPAICRLRRAEILVLRGFLDQAEQEASEAADILAVSGPWAEGDAHRVLAEVRLARGDLDAAEEAFRRAYELGWDPQPGLATIRLARGRPDVALRELEASLLDTHWRNSQRRTILLAHLVVAAVAAGTIERAREALVDLEANVDAIRTPSLKAALARAKAELAFADREADQAFAYLRQAIHLWQELSSPLEVAQHRVRLAEMLIERDEIEAADVELALAERLFRHARVPALEAEARARRPALASGRELADSAGGE
ncbi:MAG: hypothetical protein Kow0010_03380 [Dehalococcoidia bacterium]